MKQRILFSVEHLYPVGDAQLLLPLAKELAAAGKDVVVAVLGQRTSDAQLWIDAGIRVFFVNGDDTTPLHTSRDAFTVVRELRSLIRLVEPSIVHAWCREAIWLTLLATQPLPLLTELPEFRLLATELSLHPEKNFLRSAIEDKISSRIETLIVPHQLIADDLAKEGIIAQNVVQIPNGIRIGDFDPANQIALTDRGASGRQDIRRSIRESMGLPAEAYLAIAVADLVPRSRLKDLIWATDLLTCIRDDFHFGIIGVGDQLRRLQRFAGQTKARPNIHFLGLPESPETYIAASDFYWHSHLQSPQSAKLLSAMAMGIPSVSVLGPETEEIVRHQETGFATNFGARDEFARWTKFLIEQTEPGAQLARQGQNYVLENFGFDAMLDEYASLYR
jgi:glycosyltransferase involved in cell wall biosynthesis